MLGAGSRIRANGWGDLSSLARPLASPEIARKGATWIVEPIRFRARDWNDFPGLGSAGSCRSEAAISAFVTRGGGDAEASTSTIVKARQGRKAIGSVPRSGVVGKQGA
jgi:hypothetical protein